MTPKHGTRQYAMHKIFNEFQAEQYIRNYGMSITGIRPAHVTGPDKVRGSTDHVQAITLPARGLPVNFPWQSYMRCPIHVEDASEMFVRVALADSPRYNLYNSGGTPISLGALADLVREFIPDAQITFDDEGGIEESDASISWTIAAYARSSRLSSHPSGRESWISSTRYDGRRGCPL